MTNLNNTKKTRENYLCKCNGIIVGYKEKRQKLQKGLMKMRQSIHKLTTKTHKTTTKTILRHTHAQTHKNT